MSVAQQSPAPLRMSLADVAQLARVRRPVVSVWRSRAARTTVPFPEPIAMERGQELFNAAEVATWLTATGRGNNPSAAEDLAAFTTAHGASPRDDRVAFDALTAALCLTVITGHRLVDLGGDELLDLADEFDPDDEFVYAECEAAGTRLAAIAGYADALADAAISPQAAFERLMADRFRSDLPEHVSTTVSATALDLVAKIAVSLTDRDGISAVYVDPTPGSSDLLLAVIDEHGDRGPFEVMTAPGDAAPARLARRRLRVHDVYRENLPIDDAGAFAVGRPATHVAQFPTPAAPMMSDAEILAAIENIVVQLDDSQRGVVLAPASALSDGFADSDAAGIRAGMLRAGHIRAIVRLPKGLVPARSRQALALWVLGPSHHEDDAAERRTMIADLADTPLRADVVDSLVTDVTAATGNPALVRAHAFRFARPVLTRALLVTRRSLVETASPERITATEDAAALVVRIEQAAAQRALRPPELPTLVVESGTRPQPTTIGAMRDAGRLRVLAGNRIADSDLASGGGLRVLGVPELVGDSRARGIDHLVLAGKYGSARVTEPGDVVFCTAPRPKAMVDREGSSVVVYPARVLRIDAADPGGLLADVLAADINAVPANAREWRLWTVRRVADDQLAPLAASLAELRRAGDEARDRVTQLDLLTDLITHGATTGAFALQPKGH